MTSTVKRYDFSRLDSVSSEQLTLERIIHHYVVPAELSEMMRALEKVLQECVRGGCTLHSKGFRFETAKDWQQRLGEDAVYTVLSAVPGGPKALIVWEPVLALSLIDRVLAGELTEVSNARSLSEIERGVLTYVLARLCQTCHRFVDPAAMPIRLEAVHDETETVLSSLAGSDMVALAEVTLALPELSGVLQIVLPDLFIREVMATPQAESMRAGSVTGKQLHDLGDLNFLLRPSIGSVTLHAEELKGLESGDIVLLDSCHASYDGKALSGEIVFHPAKRGVPTLVASIGDAGPPATVMIKEIYREA